MKRLVSEYLNEKFEENTNPIEDLGIGIPEHSYVMHDWNASTEEIAIDFAKALRKFGIYVTVDPRGEGTDEHMFILSKKRLSNEEIKRIIITDGDETGFYGEDDEYDEGDEEDEE